MLPLPGPGEALIIADGRVMVVLLAEVERLKRGDNGIPDEPISSLKGIPEHQLGEAVARVLKLLSESEE
jgi:hypothetical protein